MATQLNDHRLEIDVRTIVAAIRSKMLGRLPTEDQPYFRWFDT
jgi:hypothetical protein